MSNIPPWASSVPAMSPVSFHMSSICASPCWFSSFSQGAGANSKSFPHYAEYVSSPGELSLSGPREEATATHTHRGACLNQSYHSEQSTGPLHRKDATPWYLGAPGPQVHGAPVLTPRSWKVPRSAHFHVKGHEPQGRPSPSTL